MYSPAATTALINTRKRIASNRTYPRIITPFPASCSLCQSARPRPSLRPFLRPSRGRKDFLAQAHRGRGDFDQLIVIDKPQGLLQIQRPDRHQAQGLVRTGGADVGELLFSGDIHVQVGWARVFATKHALVDLRARLEEQAATRLQM